MEPIQFVGIAASVAGALFAALISVMVWLGNKVYTKLDDVTEALSEVKDELHDRITKIDRRVTRVETIVDRRGIDHA